MLFPAPFSEKTPDPGPGVRACIARFHCPCPSRASAFTSWASRAPAWQPSPRSSPRAGRPGHGLRHSRDILHRRGASRGSPFRTPRASRRRTSPVDTQLVVHSAAYRKDENPELLAAARGRHSHAPVPRGPRAALGSVRRQRHQRRAWQVHHHGDVRHDPEGVGLPRDCSCRDGGAGVRRALDPRAGRQVPRRRDMRVSPPLPQLPRPSGS